MKSRLLWIAILAVGGTAAYFGLTQPHVSSIPESVRSPISDLKPAGPPAIEPPELTIPALPVIAPPVLSAPVLTPTATPSLRPRPLPNTPEVPIQPNATIDFSTGAPVVRSQGKDQEAIDLAMKDMLDASKKTGFEAKK